jgi:branched-chain amino acid aminotransferase
LKITGTLSALPIEVEVSTRPKAKPTSPLGFGVYFSDHMATLEIDKRGISNAKIQPYGPLPLDPAASALHYGQALFEGMKAFRGEDGKIRLFRPRDHMRRMAFGAERLCMPPPPENAALDLIMELIRLDEAWVPSEAGSALYIRPTLIGTEGFLGVRPSENYLFFCILSPVGSYYSAAKTTTSEGVDIFVESSQARVAPGGLGEVKAAANYAASLQAAQRAKEKGFSQVLWLDAVERRWIEEVGTMNVMFVIDGKVVTPPLAGTILGGMTRRSCLELLKDWGIPVEERPVSLQELLEGLSSGKVTEAFGTGTAAVVTPIRSFFVDQKSHAVPTVVAGALSQRLKGAIQSLQYGRAEDRYGWTLTL